MQTSKTFYPGEKKNQINSENKEYWDQFKGLSWSEFNEKIGMPINTKTKLRTKIYQYEDDLIRDTIQYRKIWVKKWLN